MTPHATKTADEILGISPEQRRIFDTVHEFWEACGGPKNRDQAETLRSMIESCILKVYGCTWVTEFERNVASATALCVLKEFERDKSEAADRYLRELEATAPHATRQEKPE